MEEYEDWNMFLLEWNDNGINEIINMISVFRSLARKTIEIVKIELVGYKQGMQDFKNTVHSIMSCHNKKVDRDGNSGE